MTRTRFMLTTLVAATAALAASLASAAPAMQVFKTATCGCCSAWVEHMRENGFDVITEDLPMADLVAMKNEVGLQTDQTSCHTARIGGYIVEGHVPASDVKRLLSEEPEALGLAVPGMPYGSPGMGEPGPDADAYEVLLLKRDGTSEPFSRYH